MAITERALYLDAATYNGAALAAGLPKTMNAAARVGSFAFTEEEVPTMANITVGTGADALVLKVNQDAYNGGAQYTVKVDGRQIGGTLTAVALASAKQTDTVTVRGDWTTGNHTVAITFLNDLWGGAAERDRNVYVTAATLNGNPASGMPVSLWDNGTKSFTVAKLAVAPPPPPPVPATDWEAEAKRLGTENTTLKADVSALKARVSKLEEGAKIASDALRVVLTP